MKKLIFLFSFLPFLSFADDFIPQKFLVRTWSSFGVEFGSINSINAPVYSVSSEDDIFSILNTSTFGVCINSSRRDFNFGVVVPSSSTNVVFISSYNALNITNSVLGVLGGSVCIASVARFPRVVSLFQSTASLYWNGYRGSGFRDIFVQGDKACVNVDYPLLYADVLSSTNTLFRQILLSHLNTIQQSVSNIEVNMSGVQSAVEQGNSISSNILSGVDNISSNVVSINSNVVDGVNAVSALSGLFKSENPLSACAVSNLISAAYDMSLIDHEKYLDWQTKMNEFSHSFYDDYPEQRQLFYDEVLTSLHSVNASYGLLQGFYNSILRDSSVSRPALIQLGTYLGQDIVDALIGDYDQTTRGAKAVNTRTSIKSQMKSWRDDVHNQLNDWKEDLKQQLQDWKTSDEHGILNIRQDLSDYLGFTNSNSSISLATIMLTNSIQNISSTSDPAISNLIQKISDFMDDTFGENGRGGGVRITYPLRYKDSAEVNVHDQALDDIIGELNSFYNSMSNLLDGIFVDLSDTFKGTNSVDWAPWFEKWEPYSDIVTNYYSEYNSSEPVADLANRFLSEGFDMDTYNGLSWFSRVEVLLAMIADTSTNLVSVADIEEELNDIVDHFTEMGTNVVVASENVVGLFDYVKRTANRFKLVFGDRSAPVTDSGITLLEAGHWIGNEPLVLKIDITVQNVLRLFFRCFWLLSALVVIWLVVSWSWQKVVAVLRWLWSMFDL